MGRYDEAEAELDKIESNFRLFNAHTAPAELRRLVDQELRNQGVDPDSLRARAAAQKEKKEEAERGRIHAAAMQFRASRPESDAVNGFLACEANENVMFHYMEQHGLDFTSGHSYEEAFLAVRDRLIPPTPKRRQIQVRKVNGIRVTHELLDRMSARDMERAMQNPAFLNAVNSLPPRTRP